MVNLMVDNGSREISRLVDTTKPVRDSLNGFLACSLPQIRATLP